MYKRQGQLIARLKDVCARLFTSDNLLVAYTADTEGYSRLPAELKTFRSVLGKGDGRTYEFVFRPDNRNEGFKTASQVNYVARCGTFAGKEAGGRKLEYTGALRVLKVIMNYEYLWMNLRVKGGAYGCKLCIRDSRITALLVSLHRSPPDAAVVRHIDAVLSRFCVFPHTLSLIHI